MHKLCLKWFVCNYLKSHRIYEYAKVKLWTNRMFNNCLLAECHRCDICIGPVTRKHIDSSLTASRGKQTFQFRRFIWFHEEETTRRSVCISSALWQWLTPEVDPDLFSLAHEITLVTSPPPTCVFVSSAGLMITIWRLHIVSIFHWSCVYLKTFLGKWQVGHFLNPFPCCVGSAASAHSSG